MTTFSIITVCRNAGPSLLRTAQSVLEQTCSSVEYIIVDGASTDGTSQQLPSLVEQGRAKGITVRYVSEPDKGIYDAMNKGVRMATGEWICFMNAGDTFHTAEVLEHTLPYSTSDAQVLYGAVCQVMHFGEVEMMPRPLTTLRRKMAFCHQSAFARRALLLSHAFDLSFPLAADYEFFHWCFVNDVRFEQIPLVVANFESEEGVSSRNRLRMNREFARINGRDRTLKWKLEYVGKVLEVWFNTAWRSLLPKKTTDSLRQHNYQKKQRQAKNLVFHA